MTITRGDEHIFLGMKIKFLGDGTVSIGMKSHLEEAIKDYPGILNGKATTPAESDLFTVDDDSPALDDGKRKSFHSLTMKLMYVCQRARPDIMTTIAFLCTRVSRARL